MTQSEPYKCVRQQGVQGMVAFRQGSEANGANKNNDRAMIYFFFASSIYVSRFLFKMAWCFKAFCHLLK